MNIDAWQVPAAAGPWTNRSGNLGVIERRSPPWRGVIGSLMCHYLSDPVQRLFNLFFVLVLPVVVTIGLDMAQPWDFGFKSLQENMDTTTSGGKRPMDTINDYLTFVRQEG
jgi:hypothetical protein